MKKLIYSTIIATILIPAVANAFPTNEQISEIYHKSKETFSNDYSKLTTQSLYKSKIINKKKNKNWEAGAFQKSFYLAIPHTGEEKCETAIDEIFKLDFVYEAKCEKDKMVIQFQDNE